MNITRPTAVRLLVLLLVLLFLGTQMPGAWRDEAFRVTHLPWQLTKVAHFVIFAALACVARLPPLRASVLAVAFGALALALATEALQRYVPGRDPSWHDVVIDMAGTALGAVVAWLFARVRKPVSA